MSDDDKVSVSISYVLRGRCIVDITRAQFDAIDDDESSDDAQLLMDELAERGELDGPGSGIEECEMVSISERKPSRPLAPTGSGAGSR